MPRAQKNWYGDTPHGDGMVFFDAFLLNAGQFLAGALTTNLGLTRNALGDYSLNRTAAGAETYQVAVGFPSIKRPVILPINVGQFQEFFGSSTLGRGTWVPGSYGTPPFTGTTQFTKTGPPPKGIQVNDVFAIYQVGVASLTSAALTLNRTTFTNAAVKVITNLPLTAVTFPLTANGANQQYAVVQSVTAPAMELADLSDLTLEFDVVMANTGTLRLYGLGAHLSFNYS